MFGMLGGPQGLPDVFFVDPQKLPFLSYHMAALLVKWGKQVFFVPL